MYVLSVLLSVYFLLLHDLHIFGLISDVVTDEVHPSFPLLHCQLLQFQRPGVL